eukprot:scaffold2334_cov118-Cylindrotheca_fusiformis.AAC.27
MMQDEKSIGETIEPNNCSDCLIHSLDDETVLPSPQDQEPIPLTQRTTIDWRLLPPLPKPRDTKRTQFYRGAIAFGGSTIICVILVHGGFSLWSGERQRESPAWWGFVISVYAVGIIEFLFLLAMYLMDPGVVKRSSVTCFPIPSQVEPYVHSYVLQQQAGNSSKAPHAPPPTELYIQSEGVNEGEIGDTYCVRCLVWRHGKKKYFHCGICQRCVADYDHHCGVFGRCIAGKLPLQGNLPFFYLILLTGGSLYWLAVTARVDVWDWLISSCIDHNQSASVERCRCSLKDAKNVRVFI